jgi:hypothetical protein
MILAMVLIVALIAVVLLGGIPIGSDTAMNTESLTYWTNTRPFQITEWAQINDTIYFTLVNVDTRRLVINTIDIGNGTRTLNPGWTFSPGAKKSLNITNLPMCEENVYDSFEYSVNFTYSSNEIQNEREVGSKPLSGKCIYG